MLIMTSAVLFGYHSGGLVPDPHNSVLESGDTKTPATHVSRHYLVWVQHLKIVFSAGTNGQIFVYLNVSQHSNTFT